jgi:hypothetical protein
VDLLLVAALAPLVIVVVVLWHKPDNFRCLLKGLGFQFEISSERRPPPK